MPRLSKHACRCWIPRALAQHERASGAAQALVLASTKSLDTCDVREVCRTLARAACLTCVCPMPRSATACSETRQKASPGQGAGARDGEGMDEDGSESRAGNSGVSVVSMTACTVEQWREREREMEREKERERKSWDGGPPPGFSPRAGRLQGGGTLFKRRVVDTPSPPRAPARQKNGSDTAGVDNKVKVRDSLITLELNFLL